MVNWSASETPQPQYDRSIVFRERFQEKIYDASTDQILSHSCLIVLRERYDNPAWNYKPSITNLTEDEKEFMEFFSKERYFLPHLLQQMGDRILRQIEASTNITDDPEWVWFSSLEHLLALPANKAVDYRIPYRGRLIPTSYFLLIQRRMRPFEGFVILDKNQENPVAE
jgi:hypothetical protein